jgi:hypothetical protein
MAEFKLGRIKFVWKNTWTTATVYYVDDIVRVGGKSYVCVVGHTASADFNTDLEAATPRWNLFSSGNNWRGEWTTSTLYQLGDLVKYGGNVYNCNDSHTSAATSVSGLESDQAKWDTFVAGLDYRAAWAISTRYKVNDLVRYGGITYVCDTGHTSAADVSLGLEDNQASWTSFNEGIEYKGTWSSSSVRYKINDVVKYGGGTWICVTSHTSSATFSVVNFAQFAEGVEYEDVWSSGTVYQIGDIVSFGGNQYIALQLHSAQTPSTATAYWGLFSEGFDFQGDWSSGTAYKIGQVVRLNGYTYLATADSTAQEPPNVTYWQRLNYGIYWRGEWQNSTAYKAGDAVRFQTNTFICILAHTSADDDSTTTGDVGRSPATDTAGTYWNALTLGSELSPLSVTGDLVYYGGAGPTRLPIGTTGQVLKVSSAGIPEWDQFWGTDHVYYVKPTGTDVAYPEGGGTLDTAWKTIRYACEQVERGPRYPDARYLLELNRVFVQREVTEFIQRQITTNTAPFTSAFVYDDFKCERDVGFTLDAVIYDLCHGGNIKSRGVANSLIGGLSEGETEAYPGLAIESDESVAAYNYMLTVVGNVLAQTAPTINYQTLNGDNSTATVAQYFNSDLTAEPTAYANVTASVTIITDAITARAAAVTAPQIAAAIASVPARRSPSNLIKIATGQYRETLPIIVPEQTCVLGDELRSTNAGPAGSLTNRSDAGYSVGALTRLQTVVDQIVRGTNVTESSGNTAVQSASFPYASTEEAADVAQLVRVMQHQIDFKISSTFMVSSADPTGYNTTFLSGFRDARTLLRENKEFIKEEITAFLTANYSSVKYSRAKCKRDVAFIIDAMDYDLTYGGTWATLVAGTAYFDGDNSTQLQIDSTEIAATVAAYGRLKAVVQEIIANIAVTKSTDNTATQFTDTTNLTGGSSANSTVGALVDIITNIIQGDSTEAITPQITVTTITGTDTLTSASHGLSVGDAVVPRITANGLVNGVKYWVVGTVDANTFQLAASYGGAALASFTNGAGIGIDIEVIDYPTATNAVTSTTALIAAAVTLDAAQETIVTAATTYITTNFPALVYNSAKCERDTRLILEAVMFDFMFNSNFKTREAAYSYLRASANDVYSLNQKAATRAAFTYVKGLAIANVGGNATAQARIETLMTTLDDIVYGATNEGSRCATGNRMVDYAVLQLERNRDYIVAEIDAYIDSTYTTTVTAATAATDVFTCTSTAWMTRNAAIRFTGTTFGGVSTTTTYYVQNVISATTFKISTARDSTIPLNITSDSSGSMTVALFYSSTACLRDVNTYIDALKYDLKYPGNYKSRYAARYYANSVTGSLEEDMYYLRDSTGVRDMTLQGLTGDLLAENEFGTSRVSAGAYCSLDAGWGPEDYRTWIINRSPYVQGVTTLGTACVGQKIDGALHNGGNDSIVSNDFTQVLSDGIGAWVTNNGRAELVSVFTYYNHIGYLAENGGRIRATNGNNSYGDFGAVAEGFDSSEIPNTAVIDNQSRFVAIADVSVDGTSAIGLEFHNAGSDYSEATGSFSGQSGIAAVAEFDEFRDDAVFQARLTTTGDDSSGQFGGGGFITSEGTAQGGSSTSIVITATDGNTSAAYVGMKVVLDGGAGRGQYAIIQSYNSGTKTADVIKESTGTAGWDHFLAGSAITDPNSSTTYIIEPAVAFTAPSYASTASTLPTSGAWRAVKYGETAAVYATLTGTYAGAGVGATFTVIRNGWKYTPSLQAAGTGYARLQTITILGTSLGGATTTNDLVITITAVNSTTGAILDFDHVGYGIGGRYVALRDGSTVGATSEDGVLWSTRASLMPSGAAWSAMAAGMLDDGSSIGKVSRFVAVAGTSANTTGAYSSDGITWAAADMVTSATWVDVAFGQQLFVAIASDVTTVRIADPAADVIAWNLTGTLSTTGFTAIAYGKNKFVAIKSGTDVTNYATSTTVTGNWSAGIMPVSSNWNSIAYGNNRFVAVSSTSGTIAAYSLDGVTWTASTLPATASWTKVTYGQGVFLAVSTTTAAATSPDGITWTLRATSTAASGFSAVTFGNRDRYGLFVGVGAGTGDVATYIRTGATTRARAAVADEKIFEVRITEPGSGYITAPTMTVTDPNNIFEVPHTVRLGKSSLATPSFIVGGTGYSTGDVLIAGDGYADNLQSGGVIAVRQLTAIPKNGSNIVFAHLPDRNFKLVTVTGLLGGNDGSRRAFYQVSPVLQIFEAPDNGTSLTTRIRFSQARMTGHDFLDIGTGNFAETNYPDAPTQNNVPANETVESGGGRVFFTTTDQDGNFRVGDLFSIEQSTGVATLNADAFNISGLQELSLGEFTLGSGSATISEFSTDPFFTANSDSVIPTQRAIKSYIASQIGGGGASLNVNSIIAGTIQIAGSTITTTGGETITMNARFNFRGGITGLPLAFNYFFY